MVNVKRGGTKVVIVVVIATITLRSHHLPLHHRIEHFFLQTLVHLLQAADVDRGVAAAVVHVGQHRGAGDSLQRGVGARASVSIAVYPVDQLGVLLRGKWVVVCGVWDGVG